MLIVFLSCAVSDPIPAPIPDQVALPDSEKPSVVADTHLRWADAAVTEADAVRQEMALPPAASLFTAAPYPAWASRLGYALVTAHRARVWWWLHPCVGHAVATDDRTRDHFRAVDEALSAAWTYIESTHSALVAGGATSPPDKPFIEPLLAARDALWKAKTDTWSMKCTDEMLKGWKSPIDEIALGEPWTPPEELPPAPEAEPERARATVSDRQSVAKVGRILTRNAPSLQSCYERRLKQDDSLRGSWVLSFTIQANGVPRGISARGKGRRDGPLESCIVGKVKQWRFSAMKGEMPVEKTLTFKPSF